MYKPLFILFIKNHVINKLKIRFGTAFSIIQTCVKAKGTCFTCNIEHGFINSSQIHKTQLLKYWFKDKFKELYVYLYIFIK